MSSERVAHNIRFRDLILVSIEGFLKTLLHDIGDISHVKVTHLSLLEVSSICDSSGSNGLLERSIGEELEGIRTKQVNDGGGVVSVSGDIGESRTDMLLLK